MQPPYEPTQPPAEPGRARKIPTVAIVVGAVGCASVLFIGVPFAVGIGMGVWGVMKSRASTEDPHTVPLTEVASTPNGLLTAHYPASFASKSIDNTTVAVSRNFLGAENEVVSLAAVPNPITNDVREIARLLEASAEKQVVDRGGTYTINHRRVANCLGGRPGWQVESTYTLPLGGPYASRACYFFDNAIAYQARYDVPVARATHEVILLERIINATELLPPPPPPDPSTVPLSQTYAPSNGLLTAHYPTDFAASPLDEGTVILSRAVAGTEGDLVTLGAVSSPITNDVREFARVLHALTEKKIVAAGGGVYTRTGERAADCLGSHPGFEVEVTYELPPGGKYISYSCFFLEKNRGYSLRYDVPASRVAEDALLMRRIVDATELAP